MPGPGEWTPSKALLQLNEAERLFADGKIDEASKMLDGTSLKDAGNEKRLLSLKEKIDVAAAALREKRERDARVKGFLENVKFAYTPEDLLGGPARDCIQAYYGAVENGYVLTDEDRKRIERCYKVGRADLIRTRKYLSVRMGRNESLFHNPKNTDNDIQQLNEWYNALRK